VIFLCARLRLVVESRGREMEFYLRAEQINVPLGLYFNDCLGSANSAESDRDEIEKRKKSEKLIELILKRI
jgi:hypothetical protein